MVFIFLVHAYQATSSNEDIIIRIVYGFAALSLPYLFVRNRLDNKQVYYDLLVEYLQFINIFFMAGIIYLVLALAKKMKLSAVGYAVVGLLFAIVAPFICGRCVGVPVLGYIVKIIIGEDYFVIYGFHKYEGFSSLQCWLITALCMIVTGGIVRLYVGLTEKNKR